MGKARCPKCRKVLDNVLSSFECLSTWDKAEKFYAPQETCKIVQRCPDCGTVLKRDSKRTAKPEKKKKRS